MLALLGKLGKDAPAETSPGILHLNDSSLYLFSDEDILLMAEAAGTLVKNDYRSDPFHARSFYRYAQAHLDELHPLHFEQDVEKLPTFALFLDTKLQQTKINCHPTMYLFISAMRAFDYSVEYKSKKWKRKAEM